MRLLRLKRPPLSELAALRAQIAAEDYNYEVGILGGPVPAGMKRDTLEVRIGSGEAVWARARDGIRHWAHFDLGWAAIETGNNPPQAGLDLVVHAALVGIHLTTACRVVAVHDRQDGDGARFGFTYGSLQSHVESGEEMFEVARHSDGDVSYRIDVMARPGRWYAWAAQPFVEHQRRRFRADSAAAMSRYVAD